MTSNTAPTTATPVKSATVVVAPTVPTPPAAPAPLNPPAVTLLAGRPVLLDGGGSVCSFDFGDPTAPFNALRGYNAAHVYDEPGAYVATVTSTGQVISTTAVTVTADTRPQVQMTVGADLAAEIGSLKVPTILLLPAGATFDVKGPVALATAGVTLRAAGAGPAPRIRRLTAAGSYSTLIVNAPDISVEGIEFDSDQPLKPTANGKVGIYALTIESSQLLVRNCTFRNIDDAFHCEPKARGLVAIGCTFTDELRGYGAYFDAMQDVTILGAVAAGSLCEHIFRMEGTQNVLIYGCDVNNSDGKETIAIRHGSCVAIMANTIRAWARISQGIVAQPGIYCTKVLFGSNHFAGTRSNGPWAQLNPGSQTVWFDGNSFDVNAIQDCVAVQAPSTDMNFTNNKTCMLPGTQKCKPLVRPFGNPAWSESGTTVVPALVSVPVTPVASSSAGSSHTS